MFFAKYEMKEDFSVFLKRVEETLKDLTPVNQRIAIFLLARTQENFEKTTTPSGAKWAKIKQRADGSSKPLNDTGLLKNSLEISFNNAEARIGTSLFYAATHNQGLRGVKKREFIPTKLPKRYQDDISEIIENYLMGQKPKKLWQIEKKLREGFKKFKKSIFNKNRIKKALKATTKSVKRIRKQTVKNVLRTQKSVNKELSRSRRNLSKAVNKTKRTTIKRIAKSTKTFKSNSKKLNKNTQKKLKTLNKKVTKKVVNSRKVAKRTFKKISKSTTKKIKTFKKSFKKTGKGSKKKNKIK